MLAHPTATPHTTTPLPTTQTSPHSTLTTHTHHTPTFSPQHSGGYDPVFLYLLTLIDALRAYAVYGQAFALVTVEFYYRFLYALMVLGELGPLAISVLPGFRSATVVLKVGLSVFSGVWVWVGGWMDW